MFHLIISVASFCAENIYETDIYATLHKLAAVFSYDVGGDSGVFLWNNICDLLISQH